MLEKRDVSQQYQNFRNRVNAEQESEDRKYNRKFHKDFTQDESFVESQDHEMGQVSTGNSYDILLSRENSQPVPIDTGDAELLDDKENLLVQRRKFNYF